MSNQKSCTPNAEPSALTLGALLCLITVAAAAPVAIKLYPGRSANVSLRAAIVAAMFSIVVALAILDQGPGVFEVLTKRTQ